MEGRNRDIGIAEKVLRAMRREVEGREGSGAVAYGRCVLQLLGREVHECGTREEVGRATSVEILEVRPENENEAAGRFQKKNMRICVQQLLRMGLVPARRWTGQAFGQRLKLRRRVAAAADKK